MTLTHIRDALPTLQKNVDGLHNAQNLQQHKVIMDWLSPMDFPAQQHDFISRKQEGTGQWFLDSPEFIEWSKGSNLLGSHKTLFCPGIPGAGKTMMAAIAIDYLHKVTGSETVGVAYLYCNYKAQTNQNASHLLASLLKQLVQTRPAIARPVVQLHDSHSRKNTRPLLQEISETLQSVCAKYSTVYIVVDALDECADQDGTRSHLLSQLFNLHKSKELCLHLMCTSRFIPDIVRRFQSMPMLEVRASNEDVKSFVIGQMPRLPKCIQKDDELKSIVQMKIIEAVDGM